MRTDHLDADAVDEALAALLEAHPRATIAAVEWNGLFCAMPASIPVTTQTLATCAKGLDLVPPQDGRTMLEQFTQAKDQGAATAHVHDRDGRDATCYVLDARERHGVLILLFAVHDGSAAPVNLPGHQALPAKFGRVRRNEVAVIVDVDEGACQLTGFDPDELIGAEPSSLIHPDDHELAVRNWFDVLCTPPGFGHRGRSRHRRKDGSWVWLEFTNYNRLEDPEHGDVVCELMDISNEMAAIDEANQGRDLLRRLTEALPLGVVQIDRDRRVVYTNRRLHQIVGVDEQATLVEQLATVIPGDRYSLERAVETVLLIDSDLTVELHLLLPVSTHVRVCQINLRSLLEPSGEIGGAILCISDVTESNRLRRELEDRATYDPLTRCYNRASILAELNRCLYRDRRPGSGIGLVFVDVNRFKPVNDLLGHAVGDDLLSLVASRLSDAVRSQDLVGRFGGDEFLVVCPDMADREVARRVGERIAEHVNGPARLGEHALDVKVSIGVVWAGGDELRAEELVARADHAMYRSKRAGDGTPVLLTDADPEPAFGDER